MIALVALGSVFIIFSAPALAAVTITNPTQNQVVPETNDFASRRFADPWDMSSMNDMAYGQYHQQIAGYSFSNGILSGRTTGTDAYFHALFPGYRDATPVGRDGGINRISTSNFDSFSVRMYSDRRTTAQMLWFFNNVWTDYGMTGFRVYPGWHTYNVDLSSNSKWTGSPMGFRFDPAYQPDVNFKIDWMRIYKRSGRRVNLNWTDTDPGSDVSVYLDRDKLPANNPLEQLDFRTSASNNSYAWDPSPYEPGSYYLYIKKSGQDGVYSPRITINRGPLIKILNPDEKGGKDYAAAETGNPWDMKDPGDVAYFTDIKDVKFGDGILSGTTVSKGGNYNDGYFHMRVNKPIDANKYHRLTFRFRYDGPFDFGYGTMTRVLWTPDRWDISKYSTSDDIVSYPQWREYTVDLKTMKLDSGYYGWKGLIREFRFDPLEVPAFWRFYVDFIQLRADDTANTGLTIQWNEARGTPPPTKVALYFDSDQSGFDGKTIAKGLTSVSGKNAYKWNTSKIPNGTYWVYLIADDGQNVAKAYSSGPVQIRH